MSYVKQSYKNLSMHLIKEFEKRQMACYYVNNGEEAKEKALELMVEGSKVAFGGSATLNEIGLIDEIKKRDYVLFDRGEAKNQEEVREVYLNAFDSEYYLMSSNAITLDGKLVNTDGNGNRIAALIYGPKNVIVIVGMNKLVNNEEEARKRIGLKASPPNTVRLNLNTPCAKTGYCHDCLTPQTICCQTVITRYSRAKGRIKIILVGEELGF